MGQEDLAIHLRDTGGPVPDTGNPQSFHVSGYNAAAQAFSKMRDYCVTPTHLNGLYLRIMYTTVLLAVQAQTNRHPANTHYSTLLANSTRLKNSGSKEEEMKLLIPIHYVSAGIAHLGQGDYRQAAISFMNTPFEFHNSGIVLGQNFERSVANGNDIAIYGGL